MARRIFISYEHDGDKAFVNGIRGLAANPNIDIQFYDESVRTAIDSYNATYIKSKIKPMIDRASILLVIVGRNTHSSKWVEWEVNTARLLNKEIVFMRRKDDLFSSMPPRVLGGAHIHNWDINWLKSL